MDSLYAIFALKRKRAELSGQIKTLEKKRRAIMSALAHVDQTLNLMGYDGDPKAIQPKCSRNTMFKRNELARTLYELARTRPELRTNLDIAKELAIRKGRNIKNVVLMESIRVRVQSTRRHIERQETA